MCWLGEYPPAVKSALYPASGGPVMVSEWEISSYSVHGFLLFPIAAFYIPNRLQLEDLLERRSVIYTYPINCTLGVLHRYTGSRAPLPPGLG